MLPSPFSWFTLERKDSSVSASVASVNQALTAKHFILNDELGGGGGGGRGRGALRKKFSMKFTDSKSQQQSPLVAFLATTVLVTIQTK